MLRFSRAAMVSSQSPQFTSCSHEKSSTFYRAVHIIGNAVSTSISFSAHRVHSNWQWAYLHGCASPSQSATGMSGAQG